MKSPFLIGERIYLRAVTEEDVTDRYVAWLSDPEVTRYLGWRAFPSTRQQILEYVRGQRAQEGLFLAIVTRQDDVHIGNIRLGPIDWVHRRAELAMILGDRSAWGQGYMTEAFELVIRHAFSALNLHKLKAGTDAANTAAIRVFRKTGWVEEGRLRQETFRDGAFRDLVLFARFNEASGMRVVATVEARMGSSRLPGKVLAEIAGKPALAHLVERLRRAQRVADIVIATTVNPADEAIERLAAQVGVRCYRGAEDDVMGRVVEAARSARAEVIVEVTGDCMLLAPEVIDRAIELYGTGLYDVVSNTWKPSYPQGIDAQVFAFTLLADAAQQTSDPAHREHVSLYFYEHPERYRIHVVEAPPEFNAPELRFQLDYPEDLAFITAVYEELYQSHPAFSLKEIFELLGRKPELKQLNAGMREKPVRVSA